MEQKAKQYLTARKKHHVIYKTTCLITSKYYIGMHSTDDLADGYLGSGKRLWSSIKKHGKENHVYEIIEHLPDRSNLRLREAELVNKTLLEDNLCMNLALGGEGGWEKVNESLTSAQRTKAGKLGGYANKHLWSKETRARVSECCSIAGSKALKDAWINNPEYMHSKRLEGVEAAKRPENITKRKATFKQIGHMQGDKNSQFGKCWVFNEEGSKSIKKEELHNYIELGYSKGRKVK